MPLTNTEVDAAVPIAGIPNRALVNAALKELIVDIASVGTPSGLVPTGGTTSQVLKKNSNTNYDYSWQADVSGGSPAWGTITGTLSAQTDLQAALDTKATILAPVTISANTALTAAAHANRTLLVNTASVVLTINNDATGGWASDDTIDAVAIGSGTFTLVQGTATLTTDSGTSADSATAVGKRVQAQRASANTWRTASPVISSSGSGAVTAFFQGVTAVTPSVGTEQTLATLNLSPITGNAFIRVTARFSAATGSTEAGAIRCKINGVQFHQRTFEANAAQASQTVLCMAHRESDTVIRGTPNFAAEYVGNPATATYETATVSSLAAGATFTLTFQRTTGADTRVISLENVVVEVIRP